MSYVRDILARFSRIFYSGAFLVQRDTLEFAGSGVAVADNATTKRTVVTISGGGGDVTEAAVRAATALAAGDFDFNNRKLTEVADPSGAQDAATKASSEAAAVAAASAAVGATGSTTATPGALARYDGGGRLQAADPEDPADVVPRSFLEAAIASAETVGFPAVKAALAAADDVVDIPTVLNLTEGLSVTGGGNVAIAVPIELTAGANIDSVEPIETTEGMGGGSFHGIANAFTVKGELPARDTLLVVHDDDATFSVPVIASTGLTVTAGTTVLGGPVEIYDTVTSTGGADFEGHVGAGNVVAPDLDTAGPLNIGTTDATDITLGRSGQAFQVNSEATFAEPINAAKIDHIGTLELSRAGQTTDVLGAQHVAEAMTCDDVVHADNFVSEDSYAIAETAPSATIGQAPRTSDDPTHDTTVTSQAPFAGAVTNLDPGNLILNVPAPVAGGTAKELQCKVSGATVLAVTETGATVTGVLVASTNCQAPFYKIGSSFVATIGGVRAPNNSTVVAARNSTNSADCSLVYLGNLDDARFGDTTCSSVVVRAASTVSLSPGGSNVVSATSAGATVTGTLSVSGAVSWPVATASPSITHTARSTDAATTALTITSQAPWASATLTNRNSGLLSLESPAPATGGAQGGVQLKSASDTFKWSTDGLGYGTLQASTNLLLLGAGNANQGLRIDIDSVAVFSGGEHSYRVVVPYNGAGTITAGRFVTSVKHQHTRATGTGSAAGAVLELQSQPGQNQTGANDNTNGGDIRIKPMGPGTGGSGAAGKDGNIALGGNGSFGGGALVVSIANATTVPASNPSGGSILYTEAGATKVRGSSGTITTIAPADPHCTFCGSDFVQEYRNDYTGEHLAFCLSCRKNFVDVHVTTEARRAGYERAKHESEANGRREREAEAARVAAEVAAERAERERRETAEREKLEAEAKAAAEEAARPVNVARRLLEARLAAEREEQARADAYQQGVALGAQAVALVHADAPEGAVLLVDAAESFRAAGDNDAAELALGLLRDVPGIGAELEADARGRGKGKAA